MKNIKIIVEYDGTNYSGWQSQNNAVAIENVVTDAIKKLTSENIKLIGASRTDAGVHSYGQTANFMTQSSIPPEKFCFAVNNLLPSDIVVKESCEVPIDFHSRFCATGKTYLYMIHNSRFPSALLNNRAYHVSKKLDYNAMMHACKQFEGTHDFEAFRAAGCSAKNAVRTIKQLYLTQDNEDMQMRITGDGFLYNMVRIIAGTLVYVGMGKINAGEISTIIEQKDRRKAGKTAPACGLYLKSVYY